MRYREMQQRCKGFHHTGTCRGVTDGRVIFIVELSGTWGNECAEVGASGCRLAIPSMVPGAEYSPAERAQRPVWQLAFYAPLEETKGIKLFCDAVEQLPKTVLSRPGFEVCPWCTRNQPNWVS